MSTQDAVIKLLDAVIASTAVQARLNELINKARVEGRTVTIDEVDALVVESNKLRSEWDDAG